MTTALFAQATDSLRTDLIANQTLNEIMNNQFVQVGASIIALIIINRLARKLVARLIWRSVRPNRYNSQSEMRKRATTVSKVVQTAVSVILGVIGIIFILGLLHVNIAALATGAGLISVIIGLSAQNTIKDFLNGIFIILENQYSVGDIITVRTNSGWEITGEVEDLSIRITKLRDLEGVQHTISNGAADVISNNTAKYSLVNITVPIAYTADVDQVKQLIDQIGSEMAAEEPWSKDIVEPVSFLRINSFDEYAVSALMIGRVKPGRQYEVAGEFRGRLLSALKTHKIKVPVAQVVTGKKP